MSLLLAPLEKPEERMNLEVELEAIEVDFEFEAIEVDFESAVGFVEFEFGFEATVEEVNGEVDVH